MIARFSKLLLLSILPLALYSQEPPCQSDNIPPQICCACDEYLSGYIQSLIDVHYYEFQVKVIVRQGVAYLFHLPANDAIARSIVWFVWGVPAVCSVECVCTEEGYVCDAAPHCHLQEGDIQQWIQQSPCCSPYAEIQGIWFPQNTVLFAPLIADPRQVTNSAALRFNDSPIGKHVGAVSFGDEFPFYRWKDLWRWHGDFEVGIEAGIFAVFDLDHPEACHTNTDFFVAAMANYAINKWSWRFRLWHLSSHIGDEFLLCNPDFDRRNLSDEGVDLFISYQLRQPIRIYSGIGYIFDRDRTFPEKPIYIEFGTEIKICGDKDYFNKLYITPFLAMHFRTWEEHEWSIDQTYALGVEWGKIQGVGKKLRVFAEYHDGFSKEGQFLKERTNYAAIRLTYGF